MVCKLSRIATIVWTIMLTVIPHCIIAAEESETSSEANTYYVKGSTDRLTLTHRMALVGHNCMVSRLTDGVEVGSGSAHLDNLCDEDLTNHYTIPSTASVTLVAGSPIVGVRDMKHYFDKDTKAGFKISGESSVLQLSVLQANYRINFYRDGKFLKTSEVEQLGFTVLDLNVGDINIGSDAVDVVAKDQPDEDYDEIALVSKDGINVSVVKGLEIYYAFVGDAEFSLTNTRIKDFDANITVTGKSSDLLDKHLSDDDLSNEALISAGLQLGSSGYAQVIATRSTDTDEQQTFEKGTEVGFVYNTVGLINIAPTPTLFLLDKAGNELYHKAVSSTVLGVNLSGGDKKVSIKAPCDFSGVKLMVFGVEVANGIGAKYAFIIPKPTSAGHQCEMSPASSLELCSCDSRYQLRWDKENYPNATWKIISTTDENVSFDKNTNVLDFGQTEAYKQETDTKEQVTVTMRLTNEDGCYQDITITYGGTDETQTSTKKNETILANANNGTKEYELGDGSSVGINILSIVKNSSNIISSKLNAYATYFGGVSIGDSYLCSIKKKEGEISDGSKALQAGFVVTAKGSGLTADVLKLMNVRIYKDGEEVDGSIATTAISAKLIGAADTRKLRYSINVPAGTSFDEIRLYSSGLLGADLSVMNIYYAYTADEDAVLDDPMEGATIVSFDNTGASINATRTQSINVANVGNGLTNLPACIDGDLETETLFPVGVNAVGGSVLAVKLGVTASKNKQLVIVVNKEAAGLGIDLANAMVIKTYKTGIEDPIETYDDWSVLGANIITLGDKGYVFLSPKEDYDEVTITEGNGVSALNSLGVYGILLRNDKDGDGTPDADEIADECKQDIVFQETVNPSEKNGKTYRDNLTMYFQRTFVPSAWNSLILPVSLTSEQFTNAFGEKAILAEGDHLYEATDAEGVEQHVIGFKKSEKDEQGYLLQANKPYIIYMDKDFVKAHQDQKIDYTWDAGAIEGEIYTVDKDLEAGGVSYDILDAKTGGEYEYDDPIMSEWKLTDLDFKGSYDPHQELKPDDYIFNAGQMYHLTFNHWMKGFRCWLEPVRTETTSSLSKTFTFGFTNSEATHIQDIANNAESFAYKVHGVYNLNGQKVDGMTGVQPGIYIVNGKKMVIK